MTYTVNLDNYGDLYIKSFAGKILKVFCNVNWIKYSFSKNTLILSALINTYSDRTGTVTVITLNEIHTIEINQAAVTTSTNKAYLTYTITTNLVDEEGGTVIIKSNALGVSNIKLVSITLDINYTVSDNLYSITIPSDYGEFRGYLLGEDSFGNIIQSSIITISTKDHIDIIPTISIANSTSNIDFDVTTATISFDCTNVIYISCDDTSVTCPLSSGLGTWTWNGYRNTTQKDITRTVTFTAKSSDGHTSTVKWTFSLGYLTKSLTIKGSDSIYNKTNSYTYTVDTTNITFYYWEIVSGDKYITLKDGVVTVLDTATEETVVTIKVISTLEPEIYNTKEITLKYYDNSVEHITSTETSTDGSSETSDTTSGSTSGNTSNNSEENSGDNSSNNSEDNSESSTDETEEDNSGGTITDDLMPTITITGKISIVKSGIFIATCSKKDLQVIWLAYSKDSEVLNNTNNYYATGNSCTLTVYKAGTVYLRALVIYNNLIIYKDIKVTCSMEESSLFTLDTSVLNGTSLLA